MKIKYLFVFFFVERIEKATEKENKKI